MKLSKKMKKGLLAALACLSLTGMAQAADLPVGGSTLSGAATIVTTTTNQMDITLTAHSVINWESFSIAADNTVNFTGAYSVLNRVTGSEASTIAGTLTSVGELTLCNPNGITIANGSSINVPCLTLMALNMTDEQAAAYFSDGLPAGGVAATGNVAINGNNLSIPELTVMGKTVSVADGVTLTIGTAINPDDGDAEFMAGSNFAKASGGTQITATEANTVNIGTAAITADEHIRIHGGKVVSKANLTATTADGIDIWAGTSMNTETGAVTSTASNTAALSGSINSDTQGTRIKAGTLDKTGATFDNTPTVTESNPATTPSDPPADPPAVPIVDKTIEEVTETLNNPSATSEEKIAAIKGNETTAAIRNESVQVTNASTTMTAPAGGDNTASGAAGTAAAAPAPSQETAADSADVTVSGANADNESEKK